MRLLTGLRGAAAEKKSANPFEGSAGALGRQRGTSNPFGGRFSVTASTALQGNQEEVDLKNTPIRGHDFETLLSRVRAGLEGEQAREPLRTLNLRGCGLDSLSVILLSKALAGNGSLTSLNLSFSPFGSVGASACAEMLKFNSALVLIDLKSSHINSTGEAQLANALSLTRRS